MEGDDRTAALPPVRLTVGVTAHRDLLPEHAPAIRARLRALFEELEQRFPLTPLQALCPLAEGGDRLFAEVARDRGIPLVVPLPLPLEHYLADFSGPGSVAEFEALCREATVLELPRAPGSTPEAIARPGQARDREYARLGVFVSSHSQLLVALWDGRRSGLVGGTDQIVRYRLYNVHPTRAESRDPGPAVIADDENDLTYHIRCARGRSGEAASPAGVTGVWLTGDPEHPRADHMPERYTRIFAATGEFNREAARWHPGEDTTALPPGCPPGIRHIARVFAAADVLANRYQRRLNFVLRATYLLAVFMGGVYVGYSTIPSQRALLYAFLALFATGLMLYEWSRRRAWHRRYLDHRVLAEGLRVQLYWALAGVTTDDGRFALESFLQTQDPDLGWIRHVMRDVELHAGVVPDPGENGLAFAARHWIGDTDDPHARGQWHYYRRKAVQRHRLHRLTERLGAVCLWSGMAIAVFLAAAGTGLSHRTHTVLLLLLGLLPLIAAVRAAYSHKRADKELIKQYRFMERAFRNAQRRLAVTTGVQERRDVLRALGNAALDEHAEWILMHRERPPEQSRL